jgi:hypothetical protein
MAHNSVYTKFVYTAHSSGIYEKPDAPLSVHLRHHPRLYRASIYKISISLARDGGVAGATPILNILFRTSWPRPPPVLPLVGAEYGKT